MTVIMNDNLSVVNIYNCHFSLNFDLQTISFNPKYTALCFIYMIYVN